MSIYQDWLDAKEAERVAVEKRRALEDRMIAELEIPANLDGTRSVSCDDVYTVKITGRMNRRIDADALRDLARESGLDEFLSTLFRWKPEINLTEWKKADETITSALSGAITTEPGRPSFAITIKEAK